MIVRCVGNEVLTSTCIAVTTGTEYPIRVLRTGMSAGQLKKSKPEKHTERLGTADSSGAASEESSGSNCRQ